MPGAGSELAGIGLAGLGGPIIGGALVATPALQAALYDPALRDFRVLDSGYLASVHPTTAEAILALTIPEGSIKAAPSHGARYHLIEYLDDRTPSIADGYSRLALRRLIDRQAILYLGTTVTIEPRTANRPAPWCWIQVDFWNLDADPLRQGDADKLRVPTTRPITG